jgi:hypothetical protein
MRAVFRCTTLMVCVLMALPIGPLACGDDDGSEENAATDPEAGAAAAGSAADASADAATAMTKPLSARTAGKACAADAECAPGTCATTLRFLPGSSGMVAPGGYCTGTCKTDEQCGEGGTCRGSYADLSGMGVVDGRCLATCSADGDCRMGYRCRNPLGQAIMPGAAMPVMGTASFAGLPTCQPGPAAPPAAP